MAELVSGSYARIEMELAENEKHKKNSKSDTSTVNKVFTIHDTIDSLKTKIEAKRSSSENTIQHFTKTATSAYERLQKELSEAEEKRENRLEELKREYTIAVEKVENKYKERVESLQRNYDTSVAFSQRNIEANQKRIELETESLEKRLARKTVIAERVSSTIKTTKAKEAVATATGTMVVVAPAPTPAPAPAPVEESMASLRAKALEDDRLLEEAERLREEQESLPIKEEEPPVDLAKELQTKIDELRRQWVILENKTDLESDEEDDHYAHQEQLQKQINALEDERIIAQNNQMNRYFPPAPRPKQTSTQPIQKAQAVHHPPTQTQSYPSLVQNTKIAKKTVVKRIPLTSEELEQKYRVE